MGELRCPTVAHRVVGGKELFQKNQSRTAVQQDVVGRPDELVAVRLKATQCQAKERWHGQVEPAATIREKERLVLALLFSWRIAAPVLFFPGNGDLTMEDLLG